MYILLPTYYQRCTFVDNEIVKWNPLEIPDDFITQYPQNKFDINDITYLDTSKAVSALDIYLAKGTELSVLTTYLGEYRVAAFTNYDALLNLGDSPSFE